MQTTAIGAGRYLEAHERAALPFVRTELRELLEHVRRNLHPAPFGRVYAAFGGVHVAVALAWLWRVDGAPVTAWDLVGSGFAIVGMGIIVLGGWQA
ncbi:MAG: hypothetical protein AB7P97_21365 [Hyphomonadaceae bacterium]